MWGGRSIWLGGQLITELAVEKKKNEGAGGGRALIYTSNPHTHNLYDYKINIQGEVEQ